MHVRWFARWRQQSRLHPKRDDAQPGDENRPSLGLHADVQLAPPESRAVRDLRSSPRSSATVDVRHRQQNQRQLKRGQLRRYLSDSHLIGADGAIVTDSSSSNVMWTRSELYRNEIRMHSRSNPRSCSAGMRRCIFVPTPSHVKQDNFNRNQNQNLPNCNNNKVEFIFKYQMTPYATLYIVWQLL